MELLVRRILVFFSIGLLFMVTLSPMVNTLSDDGSSNGLVSNQSSLANTVVTQADVYNGSDSISITNGSSSDIPVNNTNDSLNNSESSGIIDDNGFFYQHFSDDRLGVSVQILGKEGLNNTLTIKKDRSPYAPLTWLQGIVTDFIDIDTPTSFDSATIQLYYNESRLNGSSESNLRLFYFNECALIPVEAPNQSINTTSKYIEATTDHLGMWFIADSTRWPPQPNTERKNTSNQSGSMMNVRTMAQSDTAQDDSVSTFNIGDQININAVIHNTGDADINSDVLVYFYEGDPDSGGNYIGSATITGGIPQGSSETAVLNGYTISSSPVDIYVKVDPLNAIAEKDKTNNKAYKVLSITSQNDQAFNTGDIININAQVHNTGDADVTGDVLVYFYDGDPDAGGNYIGSSTIAGGIPRGSSKTAVLNGYTVESSPVDIYVKVDPLNSISEKDKSNNKAYKVLSINPQDDQVFTIGDRVNISAVVHNTGDADVTGDVLVYFYEGDPDAGGNYIGSSTITGGIPQDGSGIAVLDGYTVASAVDVYVKVDPSNSVVEGDESNNVAYRVLSIDSQNLDSDGDGLTDAEETGGMEVRGSSGSFAYGYIYTNASDRDSDGDGLNDGEEMGPRHYDANGYPYYVMNSNPNLVDSDNDGLDDAAEVEIGTKPLVADTDGDGLLDGEEVYGWDEAVSGVYMVVYGDPLVPISTVNRHVYFGTDPLKNDTDGDRYNDYYETKGTSYLVALNPDSSGITSQYCYRIQLYNPLYNEGGENLDAQSLTMDGFLHGYDDSSLYKNNPFYIQGCLDNEKAMLSVTLVPLIIPGLEWLSLGGAYELGQITTEEEPGVQIELSEASQGEMNNYAIVLDEERGASQDIIISDLRNDLTDSSGNAYDDLTSEGLETQTITELIQIVDKDVVIKFNEASYNKDIFTLCPQLAEDLNEVYRTDNYLEYREYFSDELTNIANKQKDVDFEESLPESEQDPQILAQYNRALDGAISNLKGTDGQFRTPRILDKLYSSESGQGYTEITPLNKPVYSGGPDGSVYAYTTDGNELVEIESKQVQSISRSDFQNYIEYDKVNGQLVSVGFNVNRVMASDQEALIRNAQEQGSELSQDEARQIVENYWKNYGLNKKYLIILYGPNGGAEKSSLQLDGVTVPYTFDSQVLATKNQVFSGNIQIKVVAPDCEEL